MRNFIFLIGLLISCNAFATILSDKAKIAVLTCSPGDEAYSLFGHTAIRVVDPQQSINVVYNYGTFDVSDPDFYVNFCKGWLRYYLSIEEFNSFCDYYRSTNQSVVEQDLILSSTQKQALFDALELNRKPENKYYDYDFFLDNCATRVFDIVNKVCDSALVLEKKENDTRFRTGINEYLNRGHQWLGLPINLVLTHRADRIMTVKQETFLPQYLENHLATAKYEGALIAAPAQTLVASHPKDNQDNLLLPTSVFLILFFCFLLLTMIEIITKRNLLFVSRVLAGIYVFVGVFIISLWIYSDLLVVTYNLNLLWLCASAILFFSFKRKTVRVIGIGLIAVLLLQLALNQTLPQAIPVESMLLSAVIQMRILVAWYFGHRAVQPRVMKYE